MINLSFQPELVAKCIGNLQSALSLSSISTIFYKIFNSEVFFRNLVISVGSEHFLDQLTTADSFKQRYFHLRSLHLDQMETFPGTMCGEALIYKNHIELFAFEDGIGMYVSQLKTNGDSKKILFPKETNASLNSNPKIATYAVRSKAYLAMNDRYHSCVYIYTHDGDTYLKKCNIELNDEEEIYQLEIIENHLFVVVGKLCSHKIVVFDLQSSDKHSIQLPGASTTPICFGKTHIIYTQASFMDCTPTVIPLSCLKNKTCPMEHQQGITKKGFIKYFSHGNDFLEVFEENEAISLAKLSISEDGIIETAMANEINPGFTKSIALHDNRLFMAYELFNKGTQISSYDLITKKTANVLLIPPHGTKYMFFKTRFLCVGEKVHYLRSVISTLNGQLGTQCHLTTITYSRL